MFDLEKFKTGEYYVHLPTQEIYDEAMDFLYKNGFVWGSGKQLSQVNFWEKYKEYTAVIVYSHSLQYSCKYQFAENGFKRLELNEQEGSMGEKMKRDLVKLLFEKEYSDYERAGMYSYKGRIITDYLHRTARFIDFTDKIKDDYGIKGHEVADIIIKEFDLKEYKEEE